MDFVHHQQVQDDYQNQHRHSNPGVLRFRSSPSSLSSDHSSTDNVSFNNIVATNNHKDIGHYPSLSIYYPKFDHQKAPTLMLTEAGAGRDDGATEHSVLVSSLMYCHSELPPHYPKQMTTYSNGDISSPTGIRSSSLVRQNSSPPEFFANLNPIPRAAAAVGLLSSRISEIRTRNIDEDIKPGSNQQRFPLIGSCNNEFIEFSGNYNTNGVKLMSNTQSLLHGSRPRLLSHHLSLPRSSKEMTTIMEKYFQVPDSVPCKIRAKRGGATHPRSIAERERRNKISERMRKLQDVVPKMDKETNTSDTLDLAVDYIKDLQRQLKVLSETRGKCQCSSTYKSMTNQSY